jgi:hypothetical protein
MFLVDEPMDCLHVNYIKKKVSGFDALTHPDLFILASWRPAQLQRAHGQQQACETHVATATNTTL